MYTKSRYRIPKTTTTYIQDFEIYKIQVSGIVTDIKYTRAGWFRCNVGFGYWTPTRLDVSYKESGAVVWGLAGCQALAVPGGHHRHIVFCIPYAEIVHIVVWKRILSLCFVSFSADYFVAGFVLGEQGSSEVPKLADATEERGAGLEHANERLVRLLYAALASGDAAKVGEVVDEDLEWWFYGPRREQHMMRLLTGVTACDSFAFQLTSIRAIGTRVFVEGEAPSSSSNATRVFWAHIWTVKDNRITQLREYFNTAILVTDLQPTTPSTPHEVQHHPCASLWQNRLWKSEEGRELPGLILAI